LIYSRNTVIGYRARCRDGPALFGQMPMDTDALRRLHYAAAIACGVFAALVVHILLTVFGLGLDTVLRDTATGTKQQFVSALAWWAIAGAAFIGGWAAAAYLIAAARERELVYRLAQRFLVALVFAAATAGGILSKTGNLGGTVDVVAGLTALGLGLICAFCGARLAYLNAEQV
jgi:F0F1-type ATP synthase membrane subunit c/vacuolar-type H+-ATPase subunit K